jgi:phage gpG-like protein
MSYSLTEFAELLLEATVIMPAASAEAMERAAAMMETEVKSIFGSSALAANAEATIERKGFDAPGIETGATRASIQHNSDRHEAYIGSNDERLKWLEYGTAKAGNAWGGPNPPRPVLSLAGVKKGDEAAEIVGSAVALAISIA